MFSTKTIGLVLMALGCAMPVVVYLGSHVAITMDAAKGGPPNQGAMIIAFFALTGVSTVSCPGSAAATRELRNRSGGDASV